MVGLLQHNIQKPTIIRGHKRHNKLLPANEPDIKITIQQPNTEKERVELLLYRMLNVFVPESLRLYKKPRTSNTPGKP